MKLSWIFDAFAVNWIGYSRVEGTKKPTRSISDQAWACFFGPRCRPASKQP